MPISSQAPPTSVEEFQERVLERADKKTKTVLLFLFDCLAWSLWLIRNDLVFRNVVVFSPDVSIYHVLLCGNGS